MFNFVNFFVQTKFLCSLIVFRIWWVCWLQMFLYNKFPIFCQSLLIHSLMAKMTISNRRSSSLFIYTFGIVPSKQVCILLVIFFCFLFNVIYCVYFVIYMYFLIQFLSIFYPIGFRVVITFFFR